MTITSKGQIALPKAVREMKGFGEGSKIVVLASQNKIELLPCDDADALLRSIQGSLQQGKPLTKEERNAIFDEQVRHVKAGSARRR